jgi:hypothetical protein
MGELGLAELLDQPELSSPFADGGERLTGRDKVH